MTYQMTRVRLRSIGHPDSRFRDLTISLSHPDGTPVDSLLWLANGGGKTSLLSLVFSLVLPLRRDFMGADDQERCLEEYVQTGDTSHVAIEWVDLDATGLPGLDVGLPRLVTGMVHEWVGRVAPADREADKSKLNSLYYAFTAVPGALDLDGLPILGDGGSPNSLREFADTLKEANRVAGAALNLETYANRRTAWATYLEENLGIDPGLYRYQVRMNSAEGAVAKLFRFRSSREFIEFLIEFTAGQGGTAARTLESTTGNVRSLLGKLAAKPRLAVEQRFSAAAAERLTALHEAGTKKAAALEHRLAAQAQTGSVLVSLNAAADARERAADAARSDASVLAERIGRTAEAGRNALNVAAEFDLADAKLAEAEAHSAHGTAVDRHVEAQRLADAWLLVPTLADLATCDGEIVALRGQLEAEAADAVPLRRRHDAAAVRLRSVLENAVLAETERADALADEVERHRAEAERVDAAERLAREEAAREGEAARREQERSERAHSAADRALGDDAVRAWRAEPLPLTAVAVHDAVQAAEEDLKHHHQQGRDLMDEAKQARQRAGELVSELTDCHTTLRTASATADSAARAHLEADTALAEVAAEPRLRDLAELDEDDPLDLQAVGQVLRTRLVEAAQQALADYAAHTAAASTHEAVFAAVSATGYAPANGETLDAVAHLRAAGIESRPGWAVMRDLTGDTAALERALQADDVAVLAAGVVVAPDALAAATELLSRGQLRSAGVVAVADRPAIEAALSNAGDATSAGGFSLTARVPADPALYDRRAADETHQERHRLAETAREHAHEARRSAEADRTIAERLGQVLDRYPAHELVRLAEQERWTAEEVRRGAARLKEVEDEQRALNERLEHIAGQGERHQNAARVAERAHRVLLRAAELLAEAESGRTAAETAFVGADRARGNAEQLADDLRAAKQALAVLEERRQQARSAVDELRRERDGVRILAPDDVDERSDEDRELADLRAEYARLQQEWDAETSASQAAARLDEAQKRHATLSQRLPDDAALLGEARDLLAGPDGVTAGLQSEAARRAQHDARQAASEQARTLAALETAQAQVRARRPQGREHHATLDQPPATREEALTGAAEARERAGALERLLGDLNEQHQDLEQRARQLTTAAEGLRAKARELDAGRHADTAAVADGAPDPAADGYLVAALLGVDDGGPVDDDGPAEPGAAETQLPYDERSLARGHARAVEEVTAALAAQREAADEVAECDREVATADKQLRRLGAAAEFKDVPDTIRGRVLAADTGELLGRAEQLAADLRQRAALIAQQLSDLAADTDLVIGRLVTAVRDVLTDLAKAERYAKMPPGTGTWSDRSFLIIRTGPMPDEATVTDRLRPVLDRFAANPDALAPMPLLKECVLAGAGGPQAFRVKVLKPNAPGQEPEDITKLQKFSGGEKLTVCVALYCVLARLRTHNAGHSGGGGTLVLDNPLGTSSHTQLLSLQRKVAAAHGIQLVYATGVNDLGAVGEFAHLVRLRKTWHAGVGRSYVDEEPTSITAAHVGQNER
jgi:hypothetical protein